MVSSIGWQPLGAHGLSIPVLALRMNRCSLSAAPPRRCCHQSDGAALCSPSSAPGAHLHGAVASVSLSSRGQGAGRLFFTRELPFPAPSSNSTTGEGSEEAEGDASGWRGQSSPSAAARPEGDQLLRLKSSVMSTSSLIRSSGRPGYSTPNSFRFRANSAFKLAEPSATVTVAGKETSF